jgi:hypothetical protein
MDLCTWSPFSWFEGTFQLGAHSEFLTFKRRKKLEKIANDPCCSYTQRWLLFVHPFWQGSLIILNRAGLFRRFLFSLSRPYPTGPMYSRTVYNIYIVIDVYTPEVFISFQFCRYIIQFFPLLFFFIFRFSIVSFLCMANWVSNDSNSSLNSIPTHRQFSFFVSDFLSFFATAIL